MFGEGEAVGVEATKQDGKRLLLLTIALIWMRHAELPYSTLHLVERHALDPQ